MGIARMTKAFPVKPPKAALSRHKDLERWHKINRALFRKALQRLGVASVSTIYDTNE